jgi:hypothetical protein
VTSSQPSEDIVAAHAYCSRHREEIVASEWCGCFYCVAIFRPGDIDIWLPDDPDADDDAPAADDTALCPRCGIDAVIGSRSGYPITAEFLTRMKEHWF